MLSWTLNKNIKIIINYLVGPAVFLLLLASIWQQIRNQQNWQDSLVQLKNAFTSNLPLFFPAFLLMFLNWGLEARKWQLVIQCIQPINYLNAFRAVLTGTTMASFTPYRTGEYFGRILYVEEGNRIRAIALTIVASMAQLQVTFYAGIVGLLFFKNKISHDINNARAFFWLQILIWVLIAVTLTITLIYFRVSWLANFIRGWKLNEKFTSYLEVLKCCKPGVLWRMLSLSICRYAVFILQYYLLFLLFNVRIDWWQTAESISVLFVVLAILPSFTFLTDLGVRWKAGIEIVKIYSNNSVGIFAAAFTIWLINLIIPALIGSLLILGIRIFKVKK